MIPYKLYLKMTDLAEELADDPMSTTKDIRLVQFQDSIHWPWRASQEQLDDWNQRTGLYR